MRWDFIRACEATVRRLVPRIPWFELIRFGATGVLSVGIYLAFLLPLTYAFSGLLWLAAALAYALSMVANYLLQKRFTFRSRRRHQEAVLRYLVVHAVAMGLNSGVLELMAVRLKSPLWLAQAAAVACVAVWSYSAQKFWVFIGHRAAVPEASRDES